jgi:DMSO/TMAO reductase YedYZ molybdopterin-dependent catalytic subunit
MVKTRDILGWNSLDILLSEHGGPARLFVPHLYLWKSAKWIPGITLLHEETPGFLGTTWLSQLRDPWREQRH